MCYSELLTPVSLLKAMSRLCRPARLAQLGGNVPSQQDFHQYVASLHVTKALYSFWLQEADSQQAAGAAYL